MDKRLRFLQVSRRTNLLQLSRANSIHCSITRPIIGTYYGSEKVRSARKTVLRTIPFTPTTGRQRGLAEQRKGDAEIVKPTAYTSSAQKQVSQKVSRV